jgi:hypothetical protein
MEAIADSAPDTIVKEKILLENHQKVEKHFKMWQR